MDGTELTAIADVAVPTDVYVDFFGLGAGVKRESIIVTYYDDVTVSFLGGPRIINKKSARNNVLFRRFN